MVRGRAESLSSGRSKEIVKLKRILSELADLEERIAQQTKTAFLTNLDVESFICDQTLPLAADLLLATGHAADQRSAIRSMISRGLAKGLFLGLRESGAGLYEGAYLAMRGLMAGAALFDSDQFHIAREGIRIILTTAEQHGADRKAVIRKLASGTLEGVSDSCEEEEAIKKMLLEMFEPTGRVQ